MIRMADKKDLKRMLEIYAPYVEKTAISFEYIPPSMEEFSARFESIASAFPWIVWEEDGRVLGYAYAAQAFERAAFKWDADVSIYLDEAARGKGIGTKLYEKLESIMRRMGYHTLYALITADNISSCRFHEKRGYVLEGMLKNAGFKMGKWHDLAWYSLRLREGDPACGTPLSFEAFMLESDA